MSQPNFRDFLLSYLQLDQLAGIPAQLTRLENAMATEREQIEAASSKLDDLIADVRALLESERDRLSPEGQVSLDNLTARIAAFDTEVGDADGSDAPAAGEDPNAGA